MKITKERIRQLAEWRNPLETGIIFVSVLIVLLSVRYVSLLAAVGNLSLALVTASMAFRIYRSVICAVNRTPDTHPFQIHLELDIAIPEDKASEFTVQFLNAVNFVLAQAKNLLDIQDYIMTAKVATGMYGLTFVGACFNGLTLIILAWISVFVFPRVYADNQKVVDDALAPIYQKLGELFGKRVPLQNQHQGMQQVPVKKFN